MEYSCCFKSINKKQIIFRADCELYLLTVEVMHKEINTINLNAMIWSWPASPTNKKVKTSIYISVHKSNFVYISTVKQKLQNWLKIYLNITAYRVFLSSYRTHKHLSSVNPFQNDTVICTIWFFLLLRGREAFLGSYQNFVTEICYKNR